MNVMQSFAEFISNNVGRGAVTDHPYCKSIKGGLKGLKKLAVADN